MTRRGMLELGLVAFLLTSTMTGCGRLQQGSGVSAEPEKLLVTRRVSTLGECKVDGVKLLLPGGRSLGYFFRAQNGIVACPHFDINSLGAAGIPAATAQSWSEHDFEEQLCEKIMKVNLPARALGVEPGMTVKEALILMSGERLKDGKGGMGGGEPGRAREKK